MPLARLTRDFRHRPGLTRFLPARLSADGGEVTPVEWHGSGDIPALTRANALSGGRPRPRRVCSRGELIRVLPNEKTLALRFRRQPPAWWMFPPSRKRAARRAPTPSSASSPAVLRELPRNPKGNPLEIARIAGIAAAKRTCDLIPLCHPLMLTHADVDVTRRGRGRAHRGQRRHHRPDRRRNGGADRRRRGRAHGLRHDSRRSTNRIEIQDLYLLEKTGGKSGDFRRKGCKHD